MIYISSPALEELALLPQWVVWRWEKRKGELTKVPYNAYTGGRAKSNKPETWASYEKAVQTYARGQGRYAGIGFVFNKDYTGIDCDDCINEDRSIEPWARDYINKVHSYVEISPSGTGAHIFLKGHFSGTGKRRKIDSPNHPKAAIEVYEAGRYFTWTGNHLPETPDTINEAQAALDAILLEIDPPLPKNDRVVLPSQPIFLSDQQILEKATSAKNGSKFQALWNGSTGGYLSSSEADLALCNLLAFWTGKDEGQMDRLFCLSGLYREKWDELHGATTYGAQTLLKAILNCRETYTRYETLATSSPVSNGNGNGSGNGHGHQDTEYEELLPEIYLTDQLRTLRDAALSAMARMNAKNPHVFSQPTGLSNVCRNSDGYPLLQQLGVAEIRNLLTNSANYYKIRQGREPDEVIKTSASPPKDLAEAILALPPSEWPFDPLEAVIEMPVLRPDGTILDTPGYDKMTRLYYAPVPGMEKCQVSMNPTKEEQQAARTLLLRALGDFPYESQADLANTLGAVLTPIVRPAVRDDVQMGLLDATNPGTGKGLIANFISIIATGHKAVVLAATDNDEEWDKRIIAKLLTGATIVVIDNIRGTLQSAKLEAVLTTYEYEGRLLGTSKMGKVVNRATWFATGNNLAIAGDLARRCYRIRLVSLVSNPEERTDFAIPDLLAWTGEHRAELIAALLTLARAWYAAGSPKPKRVPTLGTFTHWAHTIGGILEYAGIEGFQANREELRAESNEESGQWDAFLHIWESVFQDEWIFATSLIKEIQKEENNSQPPAGLLRESLPDFLKKALADKPHSFHITLARALGKRIKTAFGRDNIRIEREEDLHNKQKRWRVVRVVAGGIPSATYAKKEDEKKEERENTYRERGEKYPQLPALPAENMGDPDEDTAERPALIWTEKACYKCGSHYLQRRPGGLSSICVCQKEQ